MKDPSLQYEKFDDMSYRIFAITSFGENVKKIMNKNKKIKLDYFGNNEVNLYKKTENSSAR